MASLLPQALTYQHIKISAKLRVIEARERHEKSAKKRQVVRLDVESRIGSSYRYFHHTTQLVMVGYPDNVWTTPSPGARCPASH